MNNLPLQFGIQSNYGGLDYSLFCYARHSDGRVSLPEHSLQFRAIPKEEASAVTSQPILNIGKESLQSLMDELWHLGIRPTEGHGSTGQLAATERHLEHTTRLLDSTLQTVLNVAILNREAVCFKERVVREKLIELGWTPPRQTPTDTTSKTHCSPPVWTSPPDCPKCGKPLSEAPPVWQSRGQWMCHQDHDGKRIWFNYELTMILRSRIRNEASSWTEPDRSGGGGHTPEEIARSAGNVW